MDELSSLPKKGEEYLEYLPPEVRTAFLSLPGMIREKVSEIRIKNDGFTAVTWDKVSYLQSGGALSDLSKNAICVDSADFKRMIDRMCESSVYAAQNELCAGFITLYGGHRIGVCGKTAVKNGKIIALSDISGVNIRISREVFGAADKILDCITNGTDLHNTLVLSPPAYGKTTILRDAARSLGGGRYNFKVGVVDERGEIAASYKGKASNDIGALTDVYANCPKAEGMKMLLRGMSPDIIITDEIGTKDDEEAARTTINAGVKLLCSAHAYDLDDLKRRDILSSLLDANMFERIIVLSRRKGAGTIEKIY